MYSLYHYPFSQHARRVVALMEEARLVYELRHVEMMKREHLSEAHLKLNPNHQVPVLLDGDLVLYESNAILRYLCNANGLEAWYPTEVRTRAMVDQWLDWNQTQLGRATSDIVRNKVFLRDKGDLAAIAHGEARLAEAGPVLEAVLSARAFVANDRATIADLSIASNLRQLELAGLRPATPAIEAWYGRISGLAGVQAADAPLEAALATL